MRVADYICESLLQMGVSDAFGLPGGVILDFLYALADSGKIVPHLSYNEQTAGFAACGYAQVSGRLGVAYATRGPGFTNLVTAIADAYYDSLPVLFITAHAAPCPPKGMRVFNDQEIDTCAMVRNVTKFAMRIDSARDFAEIFCKACQLAQTGRKGPVLLDINMAVFSADIDTSRSFFKKGADFNLDVEIGSYIQNFVNEVGKAKRPVVLLGDGIDRITAGGALRKFAEGSGLPFLSSRCSHDLLSGSESYYGYIGSHGIRAANFILSKADLVIAIGNRLNFPPQSESFSALTRYAKFIRYEIDDAEFYRQLPNSVNIVIDANRLVDALSKSRIYFTKFGAWLSACNHLKRELARTDVDEAVTMIHGVLDSLSDDAIVVSDVGNCEFWLSRASILPGVNHRTLYSKSFGALGCGLGKAIGAYYATRKPVACVVGDQGLMVNLQELQYIAQHHLPIKIVLIDNKASGMIRDAESRRFGRLLHVTSDNGFLTPDWDNILTAFGISDYIIVTIPQELALTPNLARGDAIQNLSPRIAQDKLAILDQL